MKRRWLGAGSAKGKAHSIGCIDVGRESEARRECLRREIREIAC